jgi:type VI secretion system protein ImpE
MSTPQALELLKQSDAQGALKALQADIRSNPADAKKRIFLFQLLCVLGQWERALNQLTAIGEMDASALPMVQTYREAIKCEMLRSEVFAGKKVPMLFGQPDTWTALLIEALLRDGKGEHAEARQLRDQAFEQAPACTGTVDGQAFTWLADADMRLGPVLEAVVNGKYYWIPLDRLATVQIEAPADLRDQVWMPANFLFVNGGESVGLIPTRYVGSFESGDGALALARKTEWQESLPGFYTGLGQRLLTTDLGDLALMDVRRIDIVAPESSEASDPATADATP